MAPQKPDRPNRAIAGQDEPDRQNPEFSELSSRDPTTDEQVPLTLTQAVKASVSELWAAVAETAGMARWQADEAQGQTTLGSKFRLAWPALDLHLELAVAERVEECRLVTQGLNGQLVFELAPGQLTLRHRSQQPLSRDEAEGTCAAWQVSLSLLAHYLNRHGGQNRTVSWALAPATTSAEAAHVFFTDPDALSCWLGDGSGVGSVGDPVSLRLAWGSSLKGLVLANQPGRDVAISWAEENQSALVFRTLPIAEGRLLAVTWSSWGTSNEASPIQGYLQAAVNRLARLLSIPRDS